MEQNEIVKFMQIALKEAQKAYKIDEVPIGAVIVKDEKIIAKGYNKRESKNQAILHAEIDAIIKANRKLKSWRLNDCDIFVTVEPCLMCSGAIIQARIKNVYFGAYDLKGGAFGSSINVLEAKNINHHPVIHKEILLNECSNILKEYFKSKRIK